MEVLYAPGDAVDQEIFDVTTQATPTSLTYSSSTDLSAVFAPKGLLVQVVSGPNRGQTRYVDSATSTAVSWTSPLPYPLSYGDRIQVYQSAASALAWLTSQISAVSGGQTSQQSLIQEEIYKTAYKSPVTVATTANISLSGLPVIDGFQVQNGDRVLVKNQDSSIQNGIYTASSGGWIRSPDANDNVKVRPNMVVPVIGGADNYDSVWILDVAGQVTLSVTPLPFKNLNFLYAKLASPAFSGTPTAPTAPVDTSTTQLATTGFVVGQASASTPLANGVGASGVSPKYARADHVHPSDTSRAPVASPALTGNPTAPTASQFNNSTQIATTEFVQRALGNFASTVVRTSATEYVSASDMGKLIVLTNCVNLYMPRVADLPNGASVTIRAETPSCVSVLTINESNGDWVSLDPKYAFTAQYSTLYLMPNESVTLTLYKTGLSGGYPTLSGRWFVTAGDLLGGTPAGTIVYTSRDILPFGLLRANGAAYSRSVYARLFNTIGTYYGAGNGSTTFNVPDLRAEFIRGLDDGRSIDVGRVLGTTQYDEIRSHSHATNWQLSNEAGQVPNSIGSGSNNLEPVYFQRPTELTGGVETRPRNVALLACISY